LREAASDRARSRARRARAYGYALTTMAAAYGRLGKPQAAATLLRELSDRAAHTYLSETELILAADAAGDRDLAIRSAERAWADREPMFILFARHHPMWRSVRSDPRFQAILREMDQ
jgi:hypothetical protein